VIDPAHLGRRYGPYRYAVGLEEIRDFASAVTGGVPGRVAWGEGASEAHPWHLDEAAGQASPHGGLIAPTTFVVRFAMQPFAAACSDPALGLDLVKILHGEQAFELGEVVRPGDLIETVGEITALRQKAGLDLMTVTTRSVNQRGRVVVEGSWTAVIRR